MMNTTHSHWLLASMSIGLLFAAGVFAHADGKSADVAVADLDLSTTQGMAAARERVHQQARRLCDHVVNAWAISHQPDYVRCVDETTSAAVAQLQQRVLAVAKAHTGTSSH